MSESKNPASDSKAAETPTPALTAAERAAANLCAMRGFAKNQALRFLKQREGYEVDLLAAASTGAEMTTALEQISQNITDQTKTTGE